MIADYYDMIFKDIKRNALPNCILLPVKEVHIMAQAVMVNFRLDETDRGCLMRKIWHDTAWEEYLSWQSEDKKISILMTGSL